MDSQPVPSANDQPALGNVRVASMQVQTAILEESKSSAGYKSHLRVVRKDGATESFEASGDSLEEVCARLVSQLCIREIGLVELRRQPASVDEGPEQRQFVALVEEREKVLAELRAGVGRFVSADSAMGAVVATIRAASNAGLLKAAYRANNQKFLRSLARELVEEQLEALGAEKVESLHLSKPLQLEAEAIALEHLNQAASAAVVTATNHPKSDSILSLFDTSAWLFNRQGQRRDSFMETELWLAWYPGVQNDHLNLGEVIDSMPVTPDLKVPWIVRFFENPEGWIRFRGAVDLEDHDVLHVVLGRGLQDQDEAFVVGFAMGTAKKTSAIQFRILRFALTYLYPEPYRVPKYLQPAFRLGFECGKETGEKNLYRRSLKELRGLTVGEARQELGIDKAIVQKYYDREQQEIPFTIASLRLP